MKYLFTIFALLLSFSDMASAAPAKPRAEKKKAKSLWSMDAYGVGRMLNHKDRDRG